MSRLLAIALLFTLNIPVFAADDDPQRLRILCYNIHYGQGMDGEYDVKRLAEVINKFEPDLVALQEIDVGVERSGRVHQIRELGKHTGMASRYGPTQHYQGGLYGNGVLSKLPILDVAIHPLPYTEATEEKVTYPRGCVAVTVKLPNGKPLRFISTHFQHNVEEDRVAEAKAINQLFKDEAKKIPTILAGDMNAVPDAEPVVELLKHWSIASTSDELAPTAPSTKPRSRIDYIFLGKGKTIATVEAGVIDEQMASDHRPVFAVLEIEADE